MPQDKVVAAAAVEVAAEKAEAHDLVPHVPANYPHFTPFVENIEQVG